MLRDYRELASFLQKKIKQHPSWDELLFDENDKSELKKLPAVSEVYDHSILLKVNENHVIIPSQYLSYAVAVKELALVIREYLSFIEKEKGYKSSEEIAQMINEQDETRLTFEIDEYSKSLVLKLYSDDALNLGAKKLINEKSDGSLTLRATNDYFTSIILKIFNIPAASSSILGQFIYELSTQLTVYQYLEKKYIHKLGYIRKNNHYKGFARDLLQFLYQYDGLSRILIYLRENSEKNNLTLEDGKEIRLTSIFRKASYLLSENELKMGDKLRYFIEPLFIYENYFIYLSTEWTYEAESRLDLKNLIMLIEIYYPEFKISKDSENSFYLISAKSDLTTHYTKNWDDLLLRLEKSLIDSGLIIERSYAMRLISSLLSKPFVILTGLSGSGKTKLAQAFVQWICGSTEQYRIVPVGADWTNRDNLLGYPDALDKGNYIKPENGVVDLLIRAEKNKDQPHFLILDEMNLSHVERYFADFLSLMESREKLRLHSGSEDRNGVPAEDRNGVPAETEFPENLFIIGTVNIDETTYMFSPKVLDRANVIEFRVDENEMSDYFAKRKPLDMNNLSSRGAEFAHDFLRRAIEIRMNTGTDDEIIKTLLKFFSELKKTGAEFGYRTANEILTFVAAIRSLDPDIRTDQITDYAVMQKLLPKVHGSRKKLEPVLKTLGELCLKEGIKFDDHLKKKEPDRKAEDIRYPVSLEKIIRMHNNLLSNGFTSYAEA